jgi:cysteine desulfurase family protein (TIGR01976 family)
MTSTPSLQQNTVTTAASDTAASTTHGIDTAWVRAQFPALQLRVNGQQAIFFDGPAGTQVPQQVTRAIQDYLLHSNANTGGTFSTSRKSDDAIAAARLAMADLFHCEANEVVFGQNMTTITFALARAIGRELREGDEIVVTTLDHDANVAPWRALEEKGVVVRQAEIREEDCTLDLDDLRAKITVKTKLVAVGYASNAVGTINPVAEITRMAHAVGALMFIDAVHYAPHGALDVKALDCDFLVCSPYKFFGPHMGTLYGKREHLERLRPYKVRPASDQIPDRWETGTQMQELIAGITAAVDYLASVGRQSGAHAGTRRQALLSAYAATVLYERMLLTRLIAGLLEIPGLKFFGISDPARYAERCATVSVRIGEHNPTVVAAFLAERGIFSWDGCFYALNLTERLGIQERGGLLRMGLVHYNTMDEVERVLGALQEFARK